VPHECDRGGLFVDLTLSTVTFKSNRKVLLPMWTATTGVDGHRQFVEFQVRDFVGRDDNTLLNCTSPMEPSKVTPRTIKSILQVPERQSVRRFVKGRIHFRDKYASYAPTRGPVGDQNNIAPQAIFLRESVITQSCERFCRWEKLPPPGRSDFP